jgi:mono/diheme cytochrome c family protein
VQVFTLGRLFAPSPEEDASLSNASLHNDRSRRLRALALALGLAAPGLGPAYGADFAHGEQLARRWCASCHVVAADQTHGADNVPSFAAIAKMPGFSAERIAAFLRDPHPKMPDIQLTTQETEDLAAYITSLGK